MRTNDSYRSSNREDEFLGLDPIEEKVVELLDELDRLAAKAKTAEQWAQICEIEVKLRELGGFYARSDWT
jgi:hypothetical protein